MAFDPSAPFRLFATAGGWAGGDATLYEQGGSYYRRFAPYAQVTPNFAPISTSEPKLSTVLTHQVPGMTPALLGLTNATTYVTVKAPGPISAIQVGFVADQIIGVGGPTNTYGIDAAAVIGLTLNNGRQLKTGASGNITPVALTWGNPDPDDISGLGIGAGPGMILNPTGTAGAFTLKEGIAWSDWLQAPNEAMTATPYVNIRAYAGASNRPPAFNDVSQAYASGENNANNYYQHGYWSTSGTNCLTSATYDTNAAADNAYGLICRIRFLMAGAPGVSILVGGDSTRQGYTSTQGGANDVPGRILSYARIVRNTLQAQGRAAALCNLARVSERSGIFHRRQLQELKRGTYTHSFIQLWSVNDAAGSTPYDIYNAINRVNEMVRVCEKFGTKPIVEEPCNGNATVAPVIASYMATLEASGRAVLRFPDILCQPGSRVTYKTEYNSGDNVHCNSAGHQAVHDYIMSRRSYFGF